MNEGTIVRLRGPLIAVAEEMLGSASSAAGGVQEIWLRGPASTGR